MNRFFMLIRQTHRSSSTINIPFVFWFSALLASSFATVMYDLYTPVARSSPPRGKTKILGSICANPEISFASGINQQRMDRHRLVGAGFNLRISSFSFYLLPFVFSLLVFLALCYSA